MKKTDFINQIRDFFRRPVINQQLGESFQEDAAMLRNLAQCSMFLKKHKRGRYWYYFPACELDAPVILYLLKRNGVHPKKHMSRYFKRYRGDEASLSFRVPSSYFDARPDVLDFVNLISRDSDMSCNRAIIDGKIQELRSSLQQKQK